MAGANGVEMIRYKCKACGAKLENRDEMGGEKDRCPNCEMLHIVPLSKAQKQVTASTKRAKEKRDMQQRAKALLLRSQQEANARAAEGETCGEAKGTQQVAADGQLTSAAKGRDEPDGEARSRLAPADHPSQYSSRPRSNGTGRSKLVMLSAGMLALGVVVGIGIGVLLTKPTRRQLQEVRTPVKRSSAMAAEAEASREMAEFHMLQALRMAKAERDARLIDERERNIKNRSDNFMADNVETLLRDGGGGGGETVEEWKQAKRRQLEKQHEREMAEAGRHAKAISQVHADYEARVRAIYAAFGNDLGKHGGGFSREEGKAP